MNPPLDSEYLLDSEESLLDFGAKLAQNLPPADSHARVIELIGDVGAGKTTLTRGLARGLGIKEPITSPSFTISKSYPFRNGILIHYDFYRLEDPGLMLEDLSESLKAPQNIVVIEWANTAKNLLPENRIQIHINYTPTGRQILINPTN